MKVARSEPVGRFMAGAAEAESMLMIDTIRLAMKAPRIHPLLNESVRNLLSPSSDLCHRISSPLRILPPFTEEVSAKRTKGAAVEGAQVLLPKRKRPEAELPAPSSSHQSSRQKIPMTIAPRNMKTKPTVRR